MRLIFPLLIVPIVLAAAPADATPKAALPGAITVFSTMNGAAVGPSIGIGRLSDGNLWVNGNAFNTGGSNFELSQIQTIVSFVSGQNHFVLKLSTDNAGIPGTVLETWDFSAPATPTVITLTSLVHPNLLAGLQYWLTLGMADSQSTGAWWVNPLGQTGPVSNSQNGSFLPGAIGSQYFAFSITGVPAPVSTSAQSKLIGTPAIGNAQQGEAVSLSSDGLTAVVGGSFDNNATGAGWVYALSNGQWVPQAKLVPQGAAFNDRVGSAVAISGDGNTILLGAFVTNGSQGGTYAFTKQGGQWIQQGGKILATDAVGAAHQGAAVALSSDGNTAAIGGPADNSNVGACWVFVRANGEWTEQIKWGGAPGQLAGVSGNSQIGWSVAVSGDGNFVLCGGPADHGNTGAVWSVNRSGAGSWAQSGLKLVGDGGTFQGGSVATNSDGTVAVIGGLAANNSTSSVWTFTRSGLTWAQQGSPITGKGRHLALDSRATHLLIGNLDASAAGEAWLFGRITGGWSPREHLTPTGQIGSSAVGSAVALSDQNLPCGLISPACLIGLLGGPGDNSQVGAAWAFATAPQILTLDPAATTAGSGGFTLTVNGSGFTFLAFPSAPRVQWNGSNLATTAFGTTQLTALVPANLIANPGTASVTVVNADGSVSNPSRFTIDGTANLSLGTSTIAAGASGHLTATFSALGNSAATIQFNLAFDPSQLNVTVAPTPAATVAGKSVSISSGQPATVTISGGQQQMPDGPIVDLTIVVAPNANLGTFPLTVSNALVTVDAFSIAGTPMSSQNGAITVIPATPAWTLTKMHTGNFTLGQSGAAYTIAAANSGTAPTSGTVTVAENLPAGLTLVSMSGQGWTCSNASCTRSDSLNPQQSYPPIQVSVNVAPNAAASVTNTATVSGGGAPPATASDPTTIAPAQAQLSVVSAAPVAGSGASQSYTFQFQDSQGAQSLGVVNVLINRFIDGRGACYVAYSVPDNVLYLVPDSGSGLLPGLPLTGPGSVANSQCTIAGAGSSASINQSILTLTLNVTFTSAFGGNRVVYAAAGDQQGNNTGWVLIGVRSVPPLPTTFPIPVSTSPPDGTAASQTLTYTYQDAASANNLQTVWALINTAIDGRAACYVAYYIPGNQLFLYPDNGDGTAATSIVLAGSNTLSNSQCTIRAAGSNFTRNGAEGVLTLNYQFAPGFGGHKGIWLAAQTLGLQTSDWQALAAPDLPSH